MIVGKDTRPGRFDQREFVVKVTDFGIAMVTTMAGLPENGVIGTPGYIAPERWLGLEIGPKADVYAIGAVIYRMAFGQLPRRAIGGTVLAPPSRQAHPCDEHLLSALDRALKDDPAERTPSCGDLASDLETITQASKQSEIS